VTFRGQRLVANRGRSFQGSNVLGKGFILSPDQARVLIDRDPRNQDVLFPYLNGEDLNSRPDCSASRWVINFHDWSEERAREYSEVFAIVERDVKPVRMTNNRKVYRDYWWQYGEKRPAMLKAIADLDRVLVVARVSKTGLPVFTPAGQVMSEQTVVFASNENSLFSILSSAIHYTWAIARASSLKGDLRYTPSDVYETLPLPESTVKMNNIGRTLDSKRREIMNYRKIGLTKLYNLVHEAAIVDSDILRLRDLHVEIDQAVASAYGWADPGSSYGFHQTRQGERYTIAPATQVDILDRLLELNHQRHALDGTHSGGQLAAVQSSETSQPGEQISTDGLLF
jgi:hypothetical protein